ncbi:hypothetical protein ACJX0J_038451, partial [Zea mays]
KEKEEVGEDVKRGVTPKFVSMSKEIFIPQIQGIVIFVYHVNLDNALMWHDKKNIRFLQKNILLFLIPWYMYIDKSIKASALILQAFGLVVCDISLMFGFNAAICNF